MAATVGTPTDSDILQLVLDRVMRGLAVAQVGRVESYDPDTQRADVKPLVKRMVPSASEGRRDVAEERPVIPSVRVLHYRAGGFYIHAPLQVGDTVLLVVLDQDPSNWGRTGELSLPGDHRLHHLAHAVAIPGLFPSTAVLAGLDGENLQLGSEGGLQVTITPERMEVGGSSDAAALASACNTAFNQIADAFTTFVPGTGGANFPNPFVWDPGSTTASEKLKVED